MKTYKNILWEKTFENEGGNVLVRFSPKSQIGRCGIVEMLHLFDKNESGCVICAWEVRKIDGENFPEMKVIHDRLTSTKYSFDILEALKYGQKLAEDILYYNLDIAFINLTPTKAMMGGNYEK